MTIAQLVGLSAKELEALTDEQIKEHFGHLFVHCRPATESLLGGPKKSKVAKAQVMSFKKRNELYNAYMEKFMKQVEQDSNKKDKE